MFVQVTSDVSRYLQAALSVPVQSMYFLDESGFGVSDCMRSYEWGEGRIHITQRYTRKPYVNIIAVIRYDQILAVSVIPTTNSTTFTDFVVNALTPQLPPNSMLIQDNHPVYRAALVLDEVYEAFQVKNIGHVFFPPYSDIL